MIVFQNVQKIKKQNWINYYIFIYNDKKRPILPIS
jgi:hypothetical protein